MYFASSLLLAEAIKARSGWKILAVMLFSQLVIEVESDTFVVQRYVPSRSRENASFHQRLKTGSLPASQTSIVAPSRPLVAQSWHGMWHGIYGICGKIT